MVVGESGLGKTTFLHTLLRRYVSIYFEDPANLLRKTVDIVEVGEILIIDSSRRPSLVILYPWFSEHITLVCNQDVHLYDTPGYGDFVDNRGTINKIYKNIYDRHLHRNSYTPQEFASEAEWNSIDTRIHCLFYFSPSHRMKVWYICIVVIINKQ